MMNRCYEPFKPRGSLSLPGVDLDVSWTQKTPLLDELENFPAEKWIRNEIFVLSLFLGCKFASQMLWPPCRKSHFEILGLERRVYSFHLVWFPPENGHLLFFSGMVGGSSKNHFLLVLNSVPLCRGKVATYPSFYGGVVSTIFIFISIWGR